MGYREKVPYLSKRGPRGYEAREGKVAPTVPRLLGCCIAVQIGSHAISRRIVYTAGLDHRRQRASRFHIPWHDKTIQEQGSANEGRGARDDGVQEGQSTRRRPPRVLSSRLMNTA